MPCCPELSWQVKSLSNAVNGRFMLLQLAAFVYSLHQRAARSPIAVDSTFWQCINYNWSIRSKNQWVRRTDSCDPSRHRTLANKRSFHEFCTNYRLARVNRRLPYFDLRHNKQRSARFDDCSKSRDSNPRSEVQKTDILFHKITTISALVDKLKGWMASYVCPLNLLDAAIPTHVSFSRSVHSEFNISL